MRACYICGTECVEQVPNSPYWKCPACGVWAQFPFPSKTWHGAHEPPASEPMSDMERRANRDLADWIFQNVMQGNAGKVLDIGACYPYLLHCLRERGCEVTAWDGDPRSNDLGIPVIKADLDELNVEVEADFDLIVMVHTLEHIYDLPAAFRKLRGLIANNGRLFIRSPDNMVQGYERDLTPGHASIHPWFLALSAIAELCAQTKTFCIEHSLELIPGQRDSILVPL